MIDPNFWYPVAWSHKVRPGKTFAARYAGHPIALIRPEYGPVYALEDRCAHRQVPLSKGVVDDKGCVKCCYHGWAFDRAGKCVTVPYLNKEGVGRPVKSYPCREKSGLIDRTLAALPDARSIGYAPSCQELDSLPAGPYDRPLSCIVTEKEILHFD